MHTLGIVLSALIGVIALVSAVGKLAGIAQIQEVLDHVNVSASLRPLLPLLQIAGGVGTLLGLFVLAGLGVAASAGLAIYFAAAVVFHLRVNDGPEGFGVPAMLAVVAAAAAIIRAATI